MTNLIIVLIYGDPKPTQKINELLNNIFNIYISNKYYIHTYVHHP